MRRVIAFSICVLLGVLGGYLSAPILSVAVEQSSDPEMFAGSMLTTYKNLVVCDCNDRPANEGLKELSRYLSVLQSFKDTNQKSKVLAQEIGLTYVRLSMVERKLNQQSRADQDMKRGQSELATLGWKDLSKEHLTSLVTQLNSEYKQVGPKDKAASTTATAR